VPSVGAVTWSLAYSTLDRSPFFDRPETLEAQLRAASGVGFEWVSPDVFSLRAYRDAHGGSVRELQRIARDGGLGFFDLNGVAISADPAGTRRAVDEYLALAEQLDAVWIQTRLATDTPATREVYAAEADRVAAAGFGFLYEYSPFGPITRLRDAAALVAEMAALAPRQALNIDTWHFFRGGDTLDDLRLLDPALLACVQFDDALPAGGDAYVDTMHRRALPGTGELPLREFVAVCGEVGLGGVLSLEVLSEGLRTLDLDLYVEALVRAAGAMLG